MTQAHPPRPDPYVLGQSAAVRSGAPTAPPPMRPPARTAQGSAEPRDRRAGVRMMLVFLAAVATFVLASVLVVVPFVLLDPTIAEGEALPPRVVITALVVPQVLSALVAVVGVALFGKGPRSERIRRALALRWRGRDVGIGLAIGVAGMALTIPAALIWVNAVGAEDASSAVGDIFEDRQFSIAAALLVFFMVWLVAPLCEEVLYRGVLWRSMEHWRWNRWLILVITTVIFAIAHLELLRTPLLLVISIPIGLARLFTGNVLSAIIAHQVNNFFPALTLFLMISGIVAV